MSRRFAIIITVLLIAAVSVMIATLTRGRKAVYANPYSYVPANASLLIETSDLQGFMKEITAGNAIYSELTTIPETKRFTSAMSEISMLISEENISRFISGSKVVISLHFFDSRKSGILAVATLSEGIKGRRVSGILEETGKFKQSGNKIQGGIKLYLTKDDKPDSIFLFSGSGIIAVSSAEKLLRDAIAAEKSQNNITGKQGFVKVQNASGKGLNKIFIVFPSAGSLIDAVMGKENAGKLFSPQKGSAEGDLFLSENRIIVSGYYSRSDSAITEYPFRGNPSGEMQTHKVLPMEVAMFETLFTDDSETLPVPYSEIKGVMAGEFTRAYLPLTDTLFNSGMLYVSLINNPDIAEREIVSAAKRVFGNSLPDNDEWIEYYTPDDQVKIPVYHLPFGGPGRRFFNNQNTKDSVMVFYDRYMVTATSTEVIKWFLYSNILNKTLANSLSFRDFESSLPSRASYRFYMVPAKYSSFPEGIFSPEISSVLKANTNLTRRIINLGYQYAPSNGMLYNTFSVGYEKNIRDDSGAEWATLLDTTTYTKPFFFVNHNTGSREIFVQDYRKNGYLINQAGRVLWKISLPELIVGNVWMIDYYRNGKYQLLFAGKNNIHVIDRNGNYIEKFPVKLRAAASGPMALFDYENNKDYRIIIPGDDRVVYAYDKTGSIVKGWNSFKTTGKVKTEIKHFRVAGKDYLLLSDDISVYFLDRTGNIRMKPAEAISRAARSELRLDHSLGTSSVVFSTPDGAVKNVSFSGEVSETRFKKLSGNHSFDFFDIDNDGRGEYIFIDSSKLYLYDDNKMKIFEKEFNSGSVEGPFSLTFSSSQRKIGLYDMQNRLIWLINGDGSVTSGFPLRGASLFSAGRFDSEKQFHLIVGGDDNFLYNYRMGF